VRPRIACDREIPGRERSTRPSETTRDAKAATGGQEVASSNLASPTRSSGSEAYIDAGIAALDHRVQIWRFDGALEAERDRMVAEPDPGSFARAEVVVLAAGRDRVQVVRRARSAQRADPSHQRSTHGRVVLDGSTVQPAATKSLRVSKTAIMRVGSQRASAHTPVRTSDASEHPTERRAPYRRGVDCTARSWLPFARQCGPMF
jgi:hypothetical protein